MIEVKPIQNKQIADVKRVILKTASNIYKWKETLDEVIKRFEESGELLDIDNFESYYFGNEGILLVGTNSSEVIGSGGIRRITDETCELKRLWLLEEYQGQGIGYQIFQKLHEFSKLNGYKRMWLETDSEQKRAIHFYEKIGFYRIENYNDRNSDVYMELEIGKMTQPHTTRPGGVRG